MQRELETRAEQAAAWNLAVLTYVIFRTEQERG